MKSNHGWYYSTQISLRKSHWRNPEPHSNKFQSVTFLNRVSFELDSELDAAKEFRECRRMWKNCFPRLLLGSKRKGKLVPVRVSVPGWLFDFVSRLHDEVISYLAIWRYSSCWYDKIHVWFKIANITHALPVPVYRQTDFTPKRLSSRVYMIPLRDFVPEWNSRPGTTTGVNSRRGDSRRHDILWWYHVNKCRAMRGNRSELAPARKSPRCHVNTPNKKLICFARKWIPPIQT